VSNRVTEAANSHWVVAWREGGREGREGGVSNRVTEAANSMPTRSRHWVVAWREGGREGGREGRWAK